MEDLVRLLRGSIKSENCPLSDTFALEKYQPVIKRQKLVPLLYPGAVACGVSTDNPLMQRYFVAYCRHMLQSEAQMKMLDSLFAAFQQNRIDFLPLKGCVLKELYPKPEMRAMADADILIREDRLQDIHRTMTELGFAKESENHHTVNYRNDALYVELHKSLVPPDDTDYFAYYGNGWHLAVQAEGCRYVMRSEDTFLFLLTHLARHYRGSGIGCRQIVDLYVYRRAFPNMDENYLAGELEKLHLTQFYAHVLRLLQVWFEDEKPDPVTRHMTHFVFNGGSWGSSENGELSRAVKTAKKRGKTDRATLQSYWAAIFPSRSFLQYRYPILNRLPWMTPLIWPVRWIDVLIFRRKRIQKRLAQLQIVDKQSTERYRQELELVGLDFYFE